MNKDAYSVLVQHVTTLGVPVLGKFWMSLPHAPLLFGDNGPTAWRGFTYSQRWSATALKGCDPQLADLVEKTLRWSPSERLCAEDVRTHPYVSAPALSLRLNGEARHGLGSIADGFLHDDVLDYIQKCPELAALCADCLARNFEWSSRSIRQSEGELRMKREIVGYVDEMKPPKCRSLNGDADLKPIPSKRLRQFVKALRRCAETWLHQLTMRVRAAIDREKITSIFLVGNTALFKDEDFADNAFVYASIQVLRVSDREDGWHTDGGASLLHGALTVFGTRSLLVELNQPETTTATLPQGPGSFYVGNLCAFNHNVKHHADSTGNFIQDAESEQVQIAVMLRSDVYRLNRARKINAIPGPEQMFRIVNTETARHLAEKPFPHARSRRRPFGVVSIYCERPVPSSSLQCIKAPCRMFLCRQ